MCQSCLCIGLLERLRSAGKILSLLVVCPPNGFFPSPPLGTVLVRSGEYIVSCFGDLAHLPLPVHHYRPSPEKGPRLALYSRIASLFFLKFSSYRSPGNLFERFRGVLELIRRFEFDFRRRGFFSTIRIFGVFKVQSQTLWPYMCMCFGLFAPTQFFFECCGVPDDSW